MRDEFQGLKGPARGPAQWMKTDACKGTSQKFKNARNKVKILQASREKGQIMYKKIRNHNGVRSLNSNMEIRTDTVFKIKENHS